MPKMIPGSGNQSQKKTRAASRPELADGREQVFRGQTVFLKIDAGKTIDLQIAKRWCNPEVRFGRRTSAQAGKDAVFPTQTHGRAGFIVTGTKGACVHEAVC